MKKFMKMKMQCKNFHQRKYLKNLFIKEKEYPKKS